MQRQRSNPSVVHLVGRLSYCLFGRFAETTSTYQTCQKKHANINAANPFAPKRNERQQTMCKSNPIIQHRNPGSRAYRAQDPTGLHSSCSAHLPTIIGPVLPVPPRTLRGRASGQGPMEDGHRTSALPPRSLRDLRVSWRWLKMSGPYPLVNWW